MDMKELLLYFLPVSLFVAILFLLATEVKPVAIDELAAFQLRARECNYQTSLLASATDKRFWSKQNADRVWDYCLEYER
jgi:hypothetical protein